MASPDPNIVHVSGGGTATFTFARAITGDDGTCTTAWSTGGTGATTTFDEHAFPSEETNGFVTVTITRASDGATASYTAEWIADGF